MPGSSGGQDIKSGLDCPGLQPTMAWRKRMHRQPVRAFGARCDGAAASSSTEDLPGWLRLLHRRSSFGRAGWQRGCRCARLGPSAYLLVVTVALEASQAGGGYSY
jgi:hypothetical protein